MADGTQTDAARADPGLMVGAIYTALGVALIANLEPLSRAITPFADGGTRSGLLILRAALMIALIAVFLVFWVLTYTAVTLIVGDWFYEKIWANVEQQLGSPPVKPEVGFWREFGRSIADLLRLLIPTVLFGILLLAIGFVPIVGTVLAFVLGAFIGGWFLAVETTGLAFEGRGVRLKERRRILRTRRAMTLGFGVAAYLVFLIPAGAALAMPATVAGATMLSRRILDEAQQQATQSSVRTSASDAPS